MTTNQLSRKIALHFEPEPTGRVVPTYLDSHYYSPGGMWESFGCKQIAVGEYQRVDWHPRPYADPEIAMRLLKALLAMERCAFLEVSRLGILLRMNAGNDLSVIEHTLELAIALAFAKSVGIETEKAE